MICVECHSETQTAPCPSCGKEPRVGSRYALIERVGGGSSGVVYRGTDLTSGDEVAIKEGMLGGLAQKNRELVLREARILRQLHHPAIPKWRDELTLGVGRSAALYLVQDFVSGVDLQDNLVSHRWSEREVLHLMGEVLEVLEYLHQLHPPVVHRDIKPANLIRRTDGSLAVVDFGAVRDALRGAIEEGHTVAGTFGFMAPEQFAGRAEPRSDLYALGMTAVALLSRRAPAQLHDRLGRLEWESVVSLTPHTTALLRSLLQADPSRRPASATAVRQTIETLLAPPGAAQRQAYTAPSGPDSAQATRAAPGVAVAERPAEDLFRPQLENHALIPARDAPKTALEVPKNALPAEERKVIMAVSMLFLLMAVAVVLALTLH